MSRSGGAPARGAPLRRCRSRHRARAGRRQPESARQTPEADEQRRRMRVLRAVERRGHDAVIARDLEHALGTAGRLGEEEHGLLALARSAGSRPSSPARGRGTPSSAGTARGVRRGAVRRRRPRRPRPINRELLEPRGDRDGARPCPSRSEARTGAAPARAARAGAARWLPRSSPRPARESLSRGLHVAELSDDESGCRACEKWSNAVASSVAGPARSPSSVSRIGMM